MCGYFYTPPFPSVNNIIPAVGSHIQILTHHQRPDLGVFIFLSQELPFRSIVILQTDYVLGGTSFVTGAHLVFLGQDLQSKTLTGGF